MSAPRRGALAVLCAGACRDALDALGAAYAAAHGIAVDAAFATSAAIAARAGQGEPFDLIITTQAAIATLERAGAVIAGSPVALALSRLGVAVAAGRPKPDIGSVPAFIAALRAAPSIACADPALGTPSGVYLAALLERLGLREELTPKLRLVGAAGGAPVVACSAIVRGEAALALQQISEIVSVPGVELVGPLPQEIQQATLFSGAIATGAPRPDLARALLAFLTSAPSRKVMAAHGLEPPAP